MRSIFMRVTLFSMLLSTMPSDTLAKRYTLLPASEDKVDTVIFDLGEVLFTTSRYSKIINTVPVILKNPSLLYHLYGTDVKQELFNMLDSVPAKSCPQKEIMYNDGKRMPQIMVDWMSCQSDQDVCNAVTKHIQASEHPESLKIFFAAIAQFMFCPQNLVEAQATIDPMVDLVKKLKQRGYKLYVLSNWSKDSAKLLQEKHKDLFAHFDGVMISGEEGMGKPDPNFYQKLLNKYGLQASQCAFIDDEKYNIEAAQKLGINAVLHDSVHSVYQQLSEVGIILSDDNQ